VRDALDPRGVMRVRRRAGRRTGTPTP
jgi:hypothetical protein